MTRALLLLACAGCHANHSETPRNAPRDFCQAMARSDFEAAEAAVVAKLETVSGHVAAPGSEDLLEAWLYRQPCVVRIDPPCDETAVPALVVVLDPRWRARMHRSVRFLIRVQPQDNRRRMQSEGQCPA